MTTMQGNKGNSTSLITRAIEVIAAYKVSKGVMKYVVGPAALVGGAYYLYKKKIASPHSMT